MSTRGRRCCRGAFVGIVLAVAGITSAPVARAQDASPIAESSSAHQTAASRFEQANQLVRDAIPLLDTEPARAHEQLDKAAGLYRLALTDGSLSRGSRAELNYNLGTSSMLRGDLATAVLSLRRAELLCSPIDFDLHDRIQTNLGEARRRVHPAEGSAASASKPGMDVAHGVDAPADSTWRDWAESIEHGAGRALTQIPTAWLAAFAIAAMLIAGALGTLGVLGRLPRGGWFWAGLIGIVGLGSLGALEWRRQASAGFVPAVVLRSTQPRSAPDDVTSTPIGSPLPPGSEVTILAYSEPADPAAPRWVKARDALAQSPGEFWIPSGAVAVVSAAARQTGADAGNDRRIDLASPGQSFDP